MNCILKRNVPLQTLQTKAIIGKEEITRRIYLGFLQHIEDKEEIKENATIGSLNREILNYPSDDQRGWSIASLLGRDGLLEINGDKLSITPLGKDLLTKGTLIEPKDSTIRFTIISDPLFEYRFFSYEEIPFIERDTRKSPNESAPDWLTYPDYPVESTIAKKSQSTENREVKQYHLPGVKNKSLYLYSIDERGCKVTSDGGNCDIEIIISSPEYSRYRVKSNDTGSKNEYVDFLPPQNKRLTQSIVFDTFQHDDNELIVEDETIFAIRSYSKLSAEEKKKGTTTISKSDTPIHGFGTFDTITITDINIIVEDDKSAFQWAFNRVLSRIISYISDEEYSSICEEEANWVCSHVPVNMAISRETILRRLPMYSNLSTFLELAIIGSETSGGHPFFGGDMQSEYKEIFIDELKIALNAKPELRWYIMAPALLSFPQKGGNNA